MVSGLSKVKSYIIQTAKLVWQLSCLGIFGKLIPEFSKDLTIGPLMEGLSEFTPDNHTYNGTRRPWGDLAVQVMSVYHCVRSDIAYALNYMQDHGT